MPKKGADLADWTTRYHVWRRQTHGSYHDRLSAASAPNDTTQAAQLELTKLRAAEAKLRVGEKTKQLLPRKDVVEGASRAVQVVRMRLNALVQKMTARLAHVPDHVVAEELQQEVDDICEAFTQGMSQTLPKEEDGDCPFCSVARR